MRDYEKFGYVEGARICRANAGREGLTATRYFEMRLKPFGSLTWSSEEFMWATSRCARSRLFIPGETDMTSTAPLGFVPALFVYTTEALEPLARRALQEAFNIAIAKEMQNLKDLRLRLTNAQRRVQAG